MSRCRSCQSTDLLDFLDLGRTPLADAFPRDDKEPEKRYRLGLMVCLSCWLVQNTTTVPDEELWTGDYGFYTGASPSSVAYFAEYARWVKDRCGDKGFVVEIASNDGTLLRHFDDALGVEPSSNVAKASGLPTLVAPFGRKVAAAIGRKADIVIANNVVAHVADLDDFLGGIADLLSHRGVAFIEFQYVGDLIAGNQFDHVYHEHRSFFGVRSLDAALKPHGLIIGSVMHTPAQGGSLRVTVVHGDSPSRENRGWYQAEKWLTQLPTYQSFAGRIEYLRHRLVSLIDEEWHAGRSVAGYAASAKSTTLLNYCGIGPDRLRSIVDLTPTKIGRVTPGTHIPIVAEDSVDTYLLLAWNYLAGILSREHSFRARGGRFIVPIPMPVIL